MARQLRAEYEGAIYHVMSRGDRQMHVYCLKDNHFHLVLETPKPTLVAGRKWFLGTCKQRFNVRHRMRGHLTHAL